MMGIREASLSREERIVGGAKAVDVEEAANGEALQQQQQRVLQRQ